jgi:hypothetical protein
MTSELDPVSQARIHLERTVLERASQDAAFRDLVTRDPHAALKQLIGVDPIPGYKITVVEEQPGEVTIVLPRRIGEDELPDELLDLVSGGCSSDQLRYRWGPVLIPK